MRKRQLNWKLLAWLVAATAVSAGAVHLVHGAQMKRHAHTLLGQADQAEADGRLDHAAEYLKRYLSFNANDTDALARYGFALDRTATSDAGRSRASVVFEKVLSRDRKRDAVRRRVVEIYLDLGQFAPKESGWIAEARRHAELLTLARPDEAAAFVLLGRCLEADGEPTEARKSYEQAVKNEPRNVEASVRLAHLLRSQKLTDQGDDVLTALVQADDGAAAYLERALYRLSGGALTEAGADLAQAYQRDGKNARVLLALADLAQRQGNIEDARKWWKLGVAAHGDDAVMHAGLAVLELQQSNPKAAVAVLEAALKHDPADPELNHLLTEALLQQNDFQKAEEVIEKLRAHGGLNSLANYLTARLLLHQRRPLEAANLLEETRQQASLPPGLAAHLCLCLGDAYGQLGNNERQLEAYRKAVEIDPGLVRARVGFGSALLAKGATAAALEQLLEATRLPLPPDKTWTLYARALLQLTLALPPERREWDQVSAAIDRAGANASQVVPAARLRADALLARGQATEADATLAQATADHPKEAELWADRARLAARAGRFKDAAALLDQARAAAGDGAALRVAALECWPGAEGAQALDFLRAQETGLDGFTVADRGRVEAALATTYYWLGDTANGNRICRRLLSAATEFDDWVRLLDLVLQGKDDALVGDVVRGLKKLEGDDAGVWWRYAEAAHRVVKARRGDRSGLDEARAAITKVTALRPGWARAALLQAILHDQGGDAAKALDGYRQAFDLGERQLVAVRRLVELLAERNRFADADEVLRKAQQQLLLRGEFARAGAEIALRVPDLERAVVLARLAVPEDTTDPARLLWLGRLYADADRPKEAEATYRVVIGRAFDAENKVWRYDPLDAWQLLIALLARDQRTADAEAAIDEMRQQLAPEQQPFALGVCYEALGRMTLAEENYRTAVRQRRNEVLPMQRLAILYLRLNKPKQAEPLLLRLLDAALVAPEASRAWARRQLALLKADRGGTDNYQAALALLNENRKNGRESVADVRARTFVRATRPDDRAAALAELEAARAAQPLAPDELFRLARLYEDDWPRAQDLMDRLLKLDALNPEYLAQHIADLLAHGSANQARSLVDRLAQLEGESERVRRFRGELQKAARKGTQAEDLDTRYEGFRA